MLDDGINVILSEEMKSKLYMSNEDGVDGFKEEDIVEAETVRD